jgi:hypothetical protein
VCVCVFCACVCVCVCVSVGVWLCTKNMIYERAHASKDRETE